MPDRRPLLEREDLPLRERKRIGLAVATLLGWGIAALAAMAALVVWSLIRRGRRLRANLAPPRIVSLPDVFDRPRPEG